MYKQGDYIVKPEYLEWQIFFTGFSEKKHRGGNLAGKPNKTADPPKKAIIVPEPRREIVVKAIKILKEATVQHKISVDVIENIPDQINVEAPTTTNFPEMNIGNFTPITVSLTTPRIPETININVNTAPPNVIVGTPQVNKFIVLMPHAPEIQVPVVNDIPIIKIPTTPQVPTVSANEFNPITFNLVPPILVSPPVFNIKLGSFCNYMIPNCNPRGIDGGPFGGNPISFGSNGTNYNIAIGTSGTLGGGPLTNGNPAIRYSWGSYAPYDSTLLKVYFRSI